jgi:hypothetical protein
VFGWRHVQADNVFELLDESRIARDLEAPHEVRLEPIRTPMPRNTCRADANLGCHFTRAPMGGRIRFTLRGQLHQLCHIYFHVGCATRQITLDASKPRLDITIPPARNLHSPDPQFFGNIFVPPAIGCQQHDAGALRQPHAGELGAHQLR